MCQQDDGPSTQHYVTLCLQPLKRRLINRDLKIAALALKITRQEVNNYQRAVVQSIVLFPNQFWVVIHLLNCSRDPNLQLIIGSEFTWRFITSTKNFAEPSFSHSTALMLLLHHLMQLKRELLLLTPWTVRVRTHKQRLLWRSLQKQNHTTFPFVCRQTSILPLILQIFPLFLFDCTTICWLYLTKDFIYINWENFSRKIKLTPKSLRLFIDNLFAQNCNILL